MSILRHLVARVLTPESALRPALGNPYAPAPAPEGLSLAADGDRAPAAQAPRRREPPHAARPALAPAADEAEVEAPPSRRPTPATDPRSAPERPASARDPSRGASRVEAVLEAFEALAARAGEDPREPMGALDYAHEHPLTAALPRARASAPSSAARSASVEGAATRSSERASDRPTESRALALQEAGALPARAQPDVARADATRPPRPTLGPSLRAAEGAPSTVDAWTPGAPRDDGHALPSRARSRALSRSNTAGAQAVQISIGRIEIRAHAPASAPRPRAESPRSPGLSLSGYLEQRRGGKR